MANYTPTFNKPYPNGWVDKPSKTTPVTAAIMNSYDTAIAALEAYLRDNAIDTVTVSVEQFPSDGRQWLGTITVGSNQYKIYMPSLKYENSVSDGTKIGSITLGEQSFDVYVPASSAGGSTVSVVPKTLTGTNIAEITVDGTTYQLYAPTSGGGSGSTVTAEATLTEGTQIGKITIDGVETILYAPIASPITVDSELSATSENAVQNKVVKAEFDKVDSNFTDLEMLGWSVPKECPVQNEVNGNLFRQKVGRVDVGTLYMTKKSDSTRNIYRCSVPNIKSKSSDAKAINGYCYGWTAVASTLYWEDGMFSYDSDSAYVVFVTNTYENVDTFKQAMQGQYLYYELATPITRTIDGNEKAEQIDDSLSSLGKCKNLLKPISQTITLNGVTCTYNGDGTYTLNGTATVKTFFNFILNYNFKKDTKIIGCPPNGSSDSFGIFIYNVAGGFDYGNGFIFKKDNTTRAGIYINSGYTCNNLVFKPMLTTNLDATYNDFVPYTGDGDTLTADVAKINSDLSNLKDGTTPAAKAVADEDGNNIKSTYAKKTEIPSGSIADSELSETSTNPVQNKVVTTELNKKLETLDDESQAPDAVNFDLDSELSLTSTKGVQNKVITEALNGILKITDLSDKLKNGRYNDYSLNDDFSKCYKINNIIYGQLFITGLKDDEKPNKRILVAAFDEDYFKDRTSDASFFCGYLEMLGSNGTIYSSDKNNRIQIPLVYDPINYEIEAISLEDDTLHFQSTTILSGYFRLIT